MTEARSDWRRRWHIPERGTGPAFVLSIAAHLLLLVAIAFAVRWNTRPVGPVTVELWGGSPPPVAAEPPRAAPAPTPAPPPPPPPPVVERKADIAIEAKKLPPKVEPKKEEPKKEVPKKDDLRKAEAEKKAQQELAAKKAAEERVRKAAEEKAAEQRREAELQRLTAAAGPSERAAAPGGSSDEYRGRVVGCIRPHIIFNVPDGVRPRQFVAEFEVQLLPTGEQLGAPKLLKASGLPAYDQAVERAIRRCDPFPRPQSGAMPRNLRLTFDPVETQ